MKYLDKGPFSSRPSSNAYREGWARIWGRRDPGKSVVERALRQAATGEPVKEQPLTVVFDEVTSFTEEHWRALLSKPKKPRRRK